MSKVFGKLTAGVVKELEANTVADVINAMELTGNYTAVVNAEPADTDQKLDDGDFIVLAKSVKGGKRVILLQTDSIVLVKDGAKIWLNGNLVTRGNAKKLLVALGGMLGYDID